MPTDSATKAFITKRIGNAIAAAKLDNLKVLLEHLPRHDEFSLTDIAVGTQERAVSWLVPITGDYTVYVAPTVGAAAAGFLSGSVKAATKTPTGCTLIIANRSAATIAAAAFDVLAFPI